MVYLYALMIFFCYINLLIKRLTDRYNFIEFIYPKIEINNTI